MLYLNEFSTFFVLVVKNFSPNSPAFEPKRFTPCLGKLLALLYAETARSVAGSDKEATERAADIWTNGLYSSGISKISLTYSEPPAAVAAVISNAVAAFGLCNSNFNKSSNVGKFKW